jgi:Ca2+-binding RTX toxin-like protein
MKRFWNRPRALTTLTATVLLASSVTPAFGHPGNGQPHNQPAGHHTMAFGSGNATTNPAWAPLTSTAGYAGAIGGSVYISPVSSGQPCGGSHANPSTFTTSTSFSLPADAVSPQLRVSVHADNAVAIRLNDSLIGAHTSLTLQANFRAAPERFTNAGFAGDGGYFVPGQNKLEFSLVNVSDNCGLDFHVTVAFGLRCRTGNTAEGTDGDDVLYGTPGNDIILAGAGNDIDYGLGGDDVLRGEEGNDVLVGGPGRDCLRGERGNDNLQGGDGDDTLFGNQGQDMLSGGNAHDVLVGDDGNDTLLGAVGNDLLAGGDDNDLLNGGDGFDFLGGGDEDDTLNGGLGNDSMDGGDDDDFLFDNNGTDSMSGGDDQDSLNTIDGDVVDTTWGPPNPLPFASPPLADTNDFCNRDAGEFSACP